MRFSPIYSYPPLVNQYSCQTPFLHSELAGSTVDAKNARAYRSGLGHWRWGHGLLGALEALGSGLNTVHLVIFGGLMDGVPSICATAGLGRLYGAYGECLRFTIHVASLQMTCGSEA